MYKTCSVFFFKVKEFNLRILSKCINVASRGGSTMKNPSSSQRTYICMYARAESNCLITLLSNEPSQKSSSLLHIKPSSTARAEPMLEQPLVVSASKYLHSIYLLHLFRDNIEVRINILKWNGIWWMCLRFWHHRCCRTKSINLLSKTRTKEKFRRRIENQQKLVWTRP